MKLDWKLSLQEVVWAQHATSNISVSSMLLSSVSTLCGVDTLSLWRALQLGFSFFANTAFNVLFNKVKVSHYSNFKKVLSSNNCPGILQQCRCCILAKYLQTLLAKQNHKSKCHPIKETFMKTPTAPLDKCWKLWVLPCRELM